jgi:molybdopterin synthase catalytic subunit
LGRVSLERRGSLDIEDIINELKSSPNARSAGAIACFIGIVREDSMEPSAGKVRYLEYEAYEDAARKRLEELRREMLIKKGVVDVSIHHVIDRVPVGEEALFVAVMGRHRQDVFPVLEEIVERVKEELPIWKKEVTESKSYWVSGETYKEGSEARP